MTGTNNRMFGLVGFFLSFFHYSKSVFSTIILPPKILFPPLVLLQPCHTYFSIFFLVPSACFSLGCWFFSLFIRFLRFWDCFPENCGCQDLLPVFIVAIPLYQLPLNIYYHLTALIYLKRQWLSHTVISVTVSKSKSSGLPSSYNMLPCARQSTVSVQISFFLDHVKYTGKSFREVPKEWHPNKNKFHIGSLDVLRPLRLKEGYI